MNSRKTFLRSIAFITILSFTFSNTAFVNGSVTSAPIPINKPDLAKPMPVGNSETARAELRQLMGLPKDLKSVGTVRSELRNLESIQPNLSDSPRSEAKRAELRTTRAELQQEKQAAWEQKFGKYLDSKQVNWTRNHLTRKKVGDDMYGELLPNFVLKLVATLAGQDHTGFSYRATVANFEKVFDQIVERGGQAHLLKSAEEIMREQGLYETDYDTLVANFVLELLDVLNHDDYSGTFVHQAVAFFIEAAWAYTKRSELRERKMNASEELYLKLTSWWHRFRDQYYSDPQTALAFESQYGVSIPKDKKEWENWVDSLAADLASDNDSKRTGPERVGGIMYVIGSNDAAMVFRKYVLDQMRELDGDAKYQLIRDRTAELQRRVFGAQAIDDAIRVLKADLKWDLDKMPGSEELFREELLLVQKHWFRLLALARGAGVPSGVSDHEVDKMTAEAWRNEQFITAIRVEHWFQIRTLLAGYDPTSSIVAGLKRFDDDVINYDLKQNPVFVTENGVTRQLGLRSELRINEEYILPDKEEDYSNRGIWPDARLVSELNRNNNIVKTFNETQRIGIQAGPGQPITGYLTGRRAEEIANRAAAEARKIYATLVGRGLVKRSELRVNSWRTLDGRTIVQTDEGTFSAGDENELARKLSDHGVNAWVNGSGQVSIQTNDSRGPRTDSAKWDDSNGIEDAFRSELRTPRADVTEVVSSSSGTIAFSRKDAEKFYKLDLIVVPETPLNFALISKNQSGAPIRVELIFTLESGRRYGKRLDVNLETGRIVLHDGEVSSYSIFRASKKSGPFYQALYDMLRKLVNENDNKGHAPLIDQAISRMQAVFPKREKALNALFEWPMPALTEKEFKAFLATLKTEIIPYYTDDEYDNALITANKNKVTLKMKNGVYQKTIILEWKRKGLLKVTTEISRYSAIDGEYIRNSTTIILGIEGEKSPNDDQISSRKGFKVQFRVGDGFRFVSDNKPTQKRLNEAFGTALPTKRSELRSDSREARGAGAKRLHETSGIHDAQVPTVDEFTEPENSDATSRLQLVAATYSPAKGVTVFDERGGKKTIELGRSELRDLGLVASVQTSLRELIMQAVNSTPVFRANQLRSMVVQAFDLGAVDLAKTKAGIYITNEALMSTENDAPLAPILEQIAELVETPIVVHTNDQSAREVIDSVNGILRQKGFPKERLITRVDTREEAIWFFKAFSYVKIIASKSEENSRSLLEQISDNIHFIPKGDIRALLSAFGIAETLANEFRSELRIAISA